MVLAQKNPAAILTAPAGLIAPILYRIGAGEARRTGAAGAARAA
jgi:hypothetical protein